jgi:RNA-binding protein PNO1
MDQQADILRMRQSADRYLQSVDSTASSSSSNPDDMDDDAQNDDNQQVPTFQPVSHKPTQNPNEYRRIRCPPHRYTPLRNNWEKILPPLVEHLGLQVRFNTKTRSIEMKSNSGTSSTSLNGSIQKGADFVTAFMLGFEVQDAVALLRLDDLYIDTFQVTDVKLLKGDHLSRAIGRIAGQDGKTRFAIENATRTRIVVADQRVSILGSYANIRIARDAICGLVMGAPPGKVYNNMRGVAKRMNER